ncbi:MAG TPA: hypothetical protein P5079_01790, partial [Elusimicrobiota bacterium]|nr:hypothetical protein [Elusimicrobiota bacterium]
ALSVEEYLQELQMEVVVRSVGEETAARDAQLTQKTNQFNLTTRRYTESDIRSFFESRDTFSLFCLHLRDRFGDSGIVGVAILRKEGDDAATMDTFLLSCRVLGRGVEGAFLLICAKSCVRRGCRRMYGLYVPSAKNSQVKDFYIQKGFRNEGTGEDGAQRYLADAAELSRRAVPRYFRSVTLDGEEVK